MGSKRTDRDGHEELGRWLTRIHGLPPVRTDKVERVRKALREHTYETEFVMDQTVERISREVEWAI